MLTVPHKMKGVRLALIAALFILCGGAPSWAQSTGGWWGSNYWFDWSDFRASLGARAYLATLSSGTVRIKNDKQAAFGPSDYELSSPRYGFSRGPKLVAELHGELYVDRLGLRIDFEDYRFDGHTTDPLVSYSSNHINQLRLGEARLGVDLDLVRYPFLRLGVNYDYEISEIKFRDRHIDSYAKHFGANPMTIGLHGYAIPGRLRDIPVTMNGRVRFPIPLLKREAETKIVDWQVAGGLRPAIWDTSLYGHSTFSVGLEGGYRSVTLETEMYFQGLSPWPTNGEPASNVELNVHWQGPFVQLNLVF